MNDILKGLLAIVIGIVIILDRLGLLQRGFDIVLMLVASGMIAYGFMKSGLYDKIKNMVSSK